MSNPDLKVTPSQTIGPFFRFGTEWIATEQLVAEDHPNSIVVYGVVYDGGANPVPDAMIEIFQADENGKFPPQSGASWSGFARRLTDDKGSYEIRTVKPGSVAAANGELQAPHIAVVVFARGLLKPVFSRIYFSDEAEANRKDPLLAVIDDDEAKNTLVAISEPGGRYRFDIRLQDSQLGPETQFIQFGV